MKTLVVIGASGFGRETLDVHEAIRAQSGNAPKLLGVVDDHPSASNLAALQKRNVRYLGSTDQLANLPRHTTYVIAIGNPAIRRRIATQCDISSLTPATLIHPSATIGSETQIGSGAIICAGAHISTNVTLGRHVHVNANANVGHDSVLSDYVSLNPGATVSGDCMVESEVLLGSHAVVLQQLRIGASSIVGAAACVVHNVPALQIARGVPARIFPIESVAT